MRQRKLCHRKITKYQVFSCCSLLKEGGLQNPFVLCAYAVNIVLIRCGIHRSIRLRPRPTCEQEHLSLSNAILHDSAARPSIRARMSDFICRTFGGVMGVIGQMQ